MKQGLDSAARDRFLEILRRKVKLGQNPLLTTGEVGMLFRVSHRAVRCWADAGKLNTFRTLGKHRRFHCKQVLELLDEMNEFDGKVSVPV